MDYRGLEDLLASSAELRAALGLESVPDPSTFHWFMRHRVTPTLRKAALVPEAFPAGGDGLFPTSGPPRLHEASSEAVPDGVDGRGGPTPGHLCPGGSGRPREPVSVASAVSPGSRPASVGRCRLSMAPGGAGY
jgi:hypothetical protein